MSKYWNKMEILRQGKEFLKRQEKEKEEENNNLFISQKQPVFFVNKYHYNVKTSSKYKFNEKEIQQISEFYCRNYRIGKSENTIYVSQTDLNRYLNVLSELLVITLDNNLTGTIISFNIPVIINTELNIEVSIKSSERFDFFKTENCLMFGASSFLILSEKYRGKGLGMVLIQESLQKLYEYGGLGAYFINAVSRCDNSIPLFSWYYPLNLSKIDVPKKDKSHFNVEKIENVVKVVHENSKQSYDFYFNYMKDKNFYFAPSYKYWQKWIESFPTFIVFKNDKIIGLFSFNENRVKYSSLRCELINGIILTCIGEQPYVLKSCLYTAKNYFDILTLYEIGDLTKNVLESVFAQISHKSYINFFNTRLKINALDFYSPLF